MSEADRVANNDNQSVVDAMLELHSGSSRREKAQAPLVCAQFIPKEPTMQYWSFETWKLAAFKILPASGLPMQHVSDPLDDQPTYLMHISAMLCNKEDEADVLFNAPRDQNNRQLVQFPDRVEAPAEAHEVITGTCGADYSVCLRFNNLEYLRLNRNLGKFDVMSGSLTTCTTEDQARVLVEAWQRRWEYVEDLHDIHRGTQIGPKIEWKELPMESIVAFRDSSAINKTLIEKFYDSLVDTPVVDPAEQHRRHLHGVKRMWPFTKGVEHFKDVKIVRVEYNTQYAPDDGSLMGREIYFHGSTTGGDQLRELGHFDMLNIGRKSGNMGYHGSGIYFSKSGCRAIAFCHALSFETNQTQSDFECKIFGITLAEWSHPLELRKCSEAEGFLHINPSDVQGDCPDFRYEDLQEWQSFPDRTTGSFRTPRRPGKKSITVMNSYYGYALRDTPVSGDHIIGPDTLISRNCKGPNVSREEVIVFSPFAPLELRFVLTLSAKLKGHEPPARAAGAHGEVRDDGSADPRVIARPGPGVIGGRLERQPRMVEGQEHAQGLTRVHDQ